VPAPKAAGYFESRDGHLVRIKLAIAKDPTAPAADRLRAIESLENRALGRPTERVEQVSNPVDEALDAWSDEEIRAYLEGLDDLPSP